MGIFTTRLRLALGALSLLLWLSACSTATIEFEPPRPKLYLNAVTAVSTTVGSNEDQIYFLFGNGERFPSSGSQVIREGQTWMPDIVVDATMAGSARLFEDDTLTGDDLIGTFNYNGGEVGVYTQTMTGGLSKYELEWEVRMVQTRR